MTYLFDTNIISFLQRPKSREYPSVVAHINLYGEDEVSVSVVSFHEQLLGCHDEINQARNPSEIIRGYELLGSMVQTYSQLAMLPFDQPAADQFFHLKKQRVRIGTMDLRIAAHRSHCLAD